MEGGTVCLPAPFLSMSSRQPLGDETRHSEDLPLSTVPSSKMRCYCADLLPYVLGKKIYNKDSGG